MTLLSQPARRTRSGRKKRRIDLSQIRRRISPWRQAGFGSRHVARAPRCAGAISFLANVAPEFSANAFAYRQYGDGSGLQMLAERRGRGHRR